MHPTNGHGGTGSGPRETPPHDSGDPNGPTAPRPRQTGRPLPGRAPEPRRDPPRDAPGESPRLKHGPRSGAEGARTSSGDPDRTQRRTPPRRPSPESRPRPPYASPGAGPYVPPSYPPPGPPLAPYTAPPSPAGPYHVPHGAQPPFPPPPPKSDTAASIVWALAPILTCGAATPFTIGWAAAKLRSTMLGISAALYGLGMVAFVAAVASDGSNSMELLGMLGSGASWIGGFVHSLIIRKRVFTSSETPNDYAIAAAQQRRQLRQQARELAENDPALARELRIGRPDLPRTYDDGGLVDVNHAPAEVIAGLPGMNAQLARRVVEARVEVGGFVSAEDVSIALDLPPRLTADLVELTIYLP
ncbi:hypothetical protein Skr01_42150 [Sphaerisporangium krabiense]|uniref:Helix-hairpin-helix domain-containing protein n=1 Tax=Sphaerisporangium krabiense TaxID=763782 RepID=A0A7W8Z0Z5_9ACTN|nr:helix-hairpin-helix domain-containing protein [Sphaerisporangium krabiense]MBB5625355.1 hypothetical protein [Sphaerisporangium krabiense]GII64130.1 hypothetical protein Skr01_42150 [Sphaerisporangium krabiense]